MQKTFLKEFIEVYKESGRLMEEELLKPFELKKWIELGFLSFFNLMPPFLFFFFLNFLLVPYKIYTQKRNVFLISNIIFGFPFLLIAFLIVFLFFVYISSFTSFLYLEKVKKKEIVIFNFFEKNKKNIKEYFLFSVYFYLFFAFCLLFGLFMGINFKDFFGKFFLFLFLFLYFLVFFLFQIFIKDFYLPVSLDLNAGFLEKISFILKNIGQKSLKIFAYFLTKIILVILILSGLVVTGFVSIGILFLIFIIPVFGQALLQPVFYFLTLFSLNFYKKNFIE